MEGMTTITMLPEPNGAHSASGHSDASQISRARSANLGPNFGAWDGTEQRSNVQLSKGSNHAQPRS